jgi:AbiU2
VCTTSLIVTKHDVKAFCDTCVSLRSTWEHYRILFEGSDLKRELLQAVAHTFFSDLHALLVRHLVLEICKITDPARTMGRENLTIKFLIQHSDFSSTPATLDKLERLSGSIHAFRDKIVPARNRLIAHLDRKSVQLGQPLGGAPQDDWLQFWIDLQDFLNIMDKHHVDPNGHFYLNGIAQLSDADMLVKALKESTYFHTLLDGKETTRQASDVAFGSKFFDAN